MRRSSLLLALVATLVIAVPAMAQPASRLLTFGTGEATVTGPDSATLVNDAGEYSGVYLASRSQSGKPLNAVSFSFSYSGDVAGGAPRFSIPIDTDGNGSVDGYAFLDALNCGNTGTVSTESSTCLVYFGPDVYANWDAFAAANPDYRIAPGSIPFIIADQEGTYVISNIDLR
jgi:hypothetical protein